MLRYLLLGFTLLATVFTAFATDEKEFKKWLKQHKQEFKTFVDEHDKEFAEFLKTNWVEAEVKPEEQRDNRPKPVVIPTAKPEPISPPETRPDAPPVPVVKPLPEITPPEVKPTPSLPKTAKFDYRQGKMSETKVRMLGQSLRMPALNAPPLGLVKLSSDRIAEAWMTMAKTGFKPQILALRQAGQDLALDDWGQALLTHAYLATERLLDAKDLQLYTWFYLVKQGFDARVAFYDQKVYLMLKVEQKLFGQKYFDLESGKYYFVDLAKKRPIQVGSVYTYDKQHASANRQVRIDLSVAPNHGDTDKERRLTTEFARKAISVRTPYNSDYIEFLDHYPQLSMENYFKAELPFTTKSSLLNQLRPHLEGLSEAEALNMLLHFVQKSLSYQTDQQQFNYENYLFAGETLHYPYADCEDIAVLYAYLVKNLLGNEVIGLQYDGHIATAVAVDSDIGGDSFRVRGKSYIVADPTFINANVGQTMTGFESQSPQFIVF